jgi:threonine dehydratase
VVTHNSGNFALALARAAARLGLDCTVIMPEGASAVKVEAVRKAGARLLRCAPTQAAREAGAREVVEQQGSVFIHPSDDPRVIAGQGTVGLELALEARAGRGGGRGAALHGAGHAGAGGRAPAGG